MKRLFSVFLFLVLLLSSCGDIGVYLFEGNYFVTIDNISGINSLLGALGTEYENNYVSAGSYKGFENSKHELEFSLPLKQKDRNKLFKDSVAVFIVDPTRVSFELGVGPKLSESDARDINQTPNSVLVKYVFSKQQFLDTAFNKTFPPNENMRGVKMIPLYEEVIAKYGN